MCVIPARLKSTRLPNKMLSAIKGQPMDSNDVFAC